MKTDGFDPDMIDRSPDELISVEEVQPIGAAAEAAEKKSDASLVPLKDHPKYAKYFKMLKVGMPTPNVQLKMTSEGGMSTNSFFFFTD